jgi:hypothetical protein
VSTARCYSFQSAWDIDAPRIEVWQALAATPFSWQDWWPELKDVRDTRITADLKGTSFSCSWQAPIGYRLRTDIILSDIEYLKTVTLQTDGDLIGTVTCHIKETAGRTHVDIDWQVDTTKAWMNRLAPLLKFFFIASHHAVMRSGERGLRRHLRH